MEEIEARERLKNSPLQGFLNKYYETHAIRSGEGGPGNSGDFKTCGEENLRRVEDTGDSG